jgi:hypothetical protein
VLSCLVLATACGDDGSNPVDASGGSDGNIDAAVPVRTVSGTLSRKYVTPSGEMVIPADLRSLPVSAVVPPSFAAIAGVTTANGTFSIEGVPEGAFYLKLDRRYLEMSGSAVDLSFSLLGRPGVGAATATTPLTFDVSNLATWQAADEIQMFVPGSGTIAYAMESNASAGVPAVGATSLAGFVFDLSRADYRALIDGSAGDELYLTQLATQTTSGRTFRTVARSVVPAPFTVTNGGSANVSGTFATVTQATLDAIWDRPAFAAELIARSPRTSASNWSTFAVSVLPEASTRGFYHGAADVVVFAPGYSPDESTVTAAWSYGDPFPAAWSRFVWCRFFTYRTVQLGSAAPEIVFAELLAFRDLETISAQAPLVPVVGAVVDPLINGSDAFGALTGIGTSPTLSWTEPQIGAATKYVVRVKAVTNAGGQTTLATIATLETTATQIVVPPNILMPGDTYMFQIISRSEAGVDHEVTPNVYSLPAGWASITTAMATP